MNAEQGLLELSILNASYVKRDFSDVVVEMLKRGVPPEIVTRLEDLWKATKVIAGEVINVGRIIVIKILEFANENQKIAIGVALGAAVGALTALIPFIGPIIAPFAAVIVAVYGGINVSGDGIFTLANKSFKLLADIINSTVYYWKEK